MKVLFVNENIGGHATTHRHLKVAFADHPGIEATFLDVPPDDLPRKLVAAPVPGLAGLDLDLQPLRHQLAVSAWVRGRLRHRLDGADLVHVYTHNAALLSADLLARKPAVVAMDGTNAMNAYRLPYRTPTRFTPYAVRATRPFERRVQAAADALVANSERTATSLRDDYGVAPERVEVIPYGITAPAFSPAAAPGTAGTGRPTIVFVGTSLERKGGLQLLRVHQEHFRDRCELVLVTPEPVAPAPGVRVISDLTPGDPRLWETLRSSAIMAFPSTIDQQPNAVMEAMAAGLPVVAHPLNAIADMVENERTGLQLADHGDEALRTALEKLLDDPALRARMGEAGRARFESRFSATSTAARLEVVFTTAVERHRRLQRDHA